MNIKINAETTTTETTLPLLTVKIPTLGFKISYPSDWNVTFNDTIIHFQAQHSVLVTLTVSNTSLTLEQYTSHQINMVKSVEAGTFFKLLESTPYLLSGNPGHKIVFLNGTNADARHNYYKTSIVWTIVGDKIYQIRYSAELAKYPTYASTILDMIDSFEIL